jgi:3D (Asp-Asp-Asp) domain-containing protein
MNRISKEKSKIKIFLIRILCKIISRVKTVSMFFKNKKNIGMTTLVAIFFTIIMYLFINKVIGNSKMGVEERFLAENNSKRLIQDTVVINEETIEKQIETNVMSATDMVNIDEISAKDYVGEKISKSNEKIIKKIEDEKKAEEEAKKAEEERKAEEAAKSKTDSSNQEDNSTTNSENSSTSNGTNESTNAPSNWRAISMVATAYDLSFESCGKTPSDPGYGITASGTRATKGRTIAVDTSVIPLGTEVYIEFKNSTYESLNGYYIAEDTGGAINGNKIDIFVGDNAHTYAINFGLQNCTLYVK